MHLKALLYLVPDNSLALQRGHLLHCKAGAGRKVYHSQLTYADCSVACKVWAAYEVVLEVQSYTIAGNFIRGNDITANVTIELVPRLKISTPRIIVCAQRVVI